MPTLDEAKDASWNEARERSQIDVLRLTDVQMATVRFVHDLAFVNGEIRGLDVADATLKAVEKIGERLVGA